MNPIVSFTKMSASINLKTSWTAPSNIALVKYWGKKSGLQLPANPSVSLTLKECKTEMTVELVSKEEASLTVYLDGVLMPSFVPKIEKFIRNIKNELTFLNDYSLVVNSHNTFPHSSGIASSASSMAALALCFVDLERTITQPNSEHINNHEFYQRASFFARIGSGSAARSVYAGAASWGKAEQVSVDEYATQVELHDDMKNLCNTILIIDAAEKKVSSTIGHSLMDNHAYAAARFDQAQDHWQAAMSYLASGEWSKLGELVELEALTLHAMMMTSSQSFLLMRPDTLKVIELIREFRTKNKIAVYFTLDAGPNVHLLYLSKDKEAVRLFIEQELKGFCEGGRSIDDEVGKGPVKNEA
jgi:diphosphomevalonate decarboxylase